MTWVSEYNALFRPVSSVARRRPFAFAGSEEIGRGVVRFELFDCLNSIPENRDEFMIFVKFENLAPNGVHRIKEIPHFEVSETDMNNFWRRQVEDHAVREIAVFGDDRQAIRQRVIPYL